MFFVVVDFYDFMCFIIKVAEWVKKKKLPYLGLSPCYGFGSFEFNNSKYRFMIIERFDKDLQKLFEDNGKRFPAKVVYQIGLSLVSAVQLFNACLDFVFEKYCMSTDRYQLTSPFSVLMQINVLEYIHTAGYIHGDIKPANLLLGRKKGTENQVNIPSCF